ncbi:MAG: hypothetical protein HY775_02010 [Acidobacteria bacterium]|nr:hypothetical protein [Acidobacteriota bacterium]
MGLRRIAWALAIAGALAAAVAPGPVLAHDRDVENYVGNSGGVPECTDDWLALGDLCVGGARFYPDGGETAATITIEDDVLNPVGGYYALYRDPGHALVGNGGFCGSTAVAVGGATELLVGVSGTGAIDCYPQASGPGTTGIIIVDWS